MTDVLVSVVLPIYNVEKYLDRCVESIVNQTYTNLEILLIDDGSPDNCPRICEEWKQKDSRIRVIHKENQGLGMARNTGIEHATGEYICFFDSDDYVDTQTIADCVAAAQADNADIVCFGLHELDVSGNVKTSLIPHAGVYRQEQVRQTFLPNLIAADPNTGVYMGVRMCAWDAMYSMDLIRRKGWRFTSERQILSEDVYSLLELYAWVETVVVLPKAFYFYRVNNASLSRVFRRDRYQRIRHFYLESLALCQKLGYSQIVADQLAVTYLAFTVAALKQLIRSDLTKQEKEQEFSAIMQDDTWQNALKLLSGRPKLSRKRRMLVFCMRRRIDWLTKLMLRA